MHLHNVCSFGPGACWLSDIIKPQIPSIGSLDSTVLDFTSVNTQKITTLRSWQDFSIQADV